jgi:hypothetical protein
MTDYSNYLTRDGFPLDGKIQEVVSQAKNGSSIKVIAIEACHRCGGKGYIHGFEHIDNGVCFACGGARYARRGVRLYTKEKLDALNKVQAAKHAAQQAERDSKFAERVARADRNFPGFAIAAGCAYIFDENLDVERFETYGDDDRYADVDYASDRRWLAVFRAIHTAMSIVAKGWDYDYSERQANALRSIIADICDKVAAIAADVDFKDAQREAGVKVEAGRQEIRGKVVGFKFVRGFGYNSPDVCKVIIKDTEGRGYYGTLPSAISDAEKGDWVCLTGTVEPSDDDPLFGFFKRPAKATITARAD